MSQTQREELTEDLKDFKGKVEDILETLQNGKELDLTQESFLEFHKI